MSGGQDPLFQALWPFIRPPVAIYSSSADHSFLKFLIFNQKIGKFVEFCHSPSPFSPKFQLFTSKNSLKMAALQPLFFPKIHSLDPKFGASGQTPPPISKSSAPRVYIKLPYPHTFYMYTSPHTQLTPTLSCNSMMHKMWIFTHNQSYFH